MSDQDEIARLRAEVERLTAENAALKAERDEARRMCCESVGVIMGVNPEILLERSNRAVMRDARRIAAERGWDCYGEVQP